MLAVASLPALSADHGGLSAAWLRARDAWLSVRARSEHTKRAYRAALGAFEAFLAGWGKQLWEADSDAVRAWQARMERAGLSAATIAQRMAAVSGFYGFVAAERQLVEGVEVSIFVDARGVPRANPFRTENIQRPRPQRYGHSQPLPGTAVKKMLGKINRSTLTGKRDYALLLTFLYTGWRSAEVLGMRWGDISASERAGEYVCKWRGKGGKESNEVLPGKVYAAIAEYLVAAGRDLGAEEHIWLPLNTAGCHNFHNAQPCAEKPISGTQANNIFRKRLRAAGIADSEQWHIHSLRHTFAHAYHTGKRDMLALAKQLHHSSVATTQVYLDALTAPVDDYSQALNEAYGV